MKFIAAPNDLMILDDWSHPKLDDRLRHPKMDDYNHPYLDDSLRHPKMDD